MWNEVLARLWGDQEGWAFVGRKAPDGSWRERAFKYPGQANILINEAAAWNKAGNSVYFCPHLFTDTTRQKEHAARLTALYADLDETDPQKFDKKLRPTIAWESSKGRYVALWLLDEPADPQGAEAVNKRLSYYLGADRGGWDLTQYLRWPGSVNYKYDPPHTGRLLWNNGPNYQLSAIDKLVPDVPGAKSEPVTEIGGALTQYAAKIPREAMKLMQATPKPSDDWSDHLWRLECLLVEAGFPREAVFSLVKQSPWNKYERDGRGDQPLIAEVDKAFASVEAKQPAVEVALPPMEILTLDEVLSCTAEARWLVKDIWLDGNVGWIAGVGKNYKSVISLDLGLSVASGVPFLGKFPVLRPGPVIMVQEEDPLYRVRSRLHAMMVGKNVTVEGGTMGWVEEHKKYRMVFAPPTDIPLYLAIGQGFSFADRAKMEQLEQLIDTIRPRLVVLDPFYIMAVGVDEFKAGEVTAIFNEIKRMRNTYGCSFSIVHHFRKSGGDPSQRLYGNMAFYAFSENTFWVTRRGQMVTIERDIKDAIFDQAITIEVINLDDKYDIVVQEGPVEVQDLIEALYELKVGESILIRDLATQLGLNRTQAEKAVGNLAARGWVEIDYSGRGGAKGVVTLPAFYRRIDEV